MGTLEEDVAALHAASFGWAMSCCGRDRDAACDVLQEAYFKVLSGRAKFDGRASLRTWLFGVIRFTAMESRRFSLRRWMTRHAEVPASGPANDARVAHEEPAADGPSPSERLADAERAAALGRALAKLPARQREVLHLVFYEDMSLAEAAAVMDVTTGTASQHYDRGKSQLAAILREEGIRP